MVCEPRAALRIAKHEPHLRESTTQVSLITNNTAFVIHLKEMPKVLASEERLGIVKIKTILFNPVRELLHRYRVPTHFVPRGIGIVIGLVLIFLPFEKLLEQP